MKAGNGNYMADTAEFECGIRFIINTVSFTQQQCAGKSRRVCRKGRLNDFDDTMTDEGRIILKRNLPRPANRQISSRPCRQKDIVGTIVIRFMAASR